MLQCPACGAEMEPVLESGVALQRCRRCPRAWLERAQLPALLGGVPRRFSPSDLANLRRVCARRKESAVAEAELLGSVDYFNCPVCARRMLRKSFARVSYVVVQVCPEHGMLLSGSALAELREFLATGGEVLIWERLYADLADKLTKLAKKVRRRGGGDFLPDHPLNAEISLLHALSETPPAEDNLPDGLD